MQTLRDRVAQHGDELALIDEFGSWTWREYDARLDRLVHGMRGLGLGLGHTLALLGNNRHEWCEVMSACTVSGVVTVPVNWHFSVDEIAYVLENSGATAIVADAEFADTARAAAERAGVAVRIAFAGSSGPMPTIDLAGHGAPR